MDDSREKLIRQLTVIFASSRGVESVAQRVCDAGRQMLSADRAAVTLSTTAGTRVKVPTSGDLSSQLEDLQNVVEEGPTIDAIATGTVQLASFGTRANVEWSPMREHGARLGFSGAIIAFPPCWTTASLVR